MSADYTYTNLAVDSAGQTRINTFYHQVNSRVAYISSFGLAGYLQASYIYGAPFSSADFSPGASSSPVSFILFNAKVSYEVAKGINPFIAIENLFDTDYFRVRRFPEPGRRIFIGVNARF